MEFRFTQVHVTILNFVLVGALALASAMTVRDIVEHSVTNEPDAPSVATSGRRAATGPRTRAYYDAIVKRDIFNQTPQESGPAPVVEADLSIKLIGTSLMTKSKPYAIIEDDAGNESLYQVGEDIPDAGKLVNVEVNRAIIDRGDGHRVSIEIPTSDMPEASPSNLGGTIRAPSAFRGIPALRNRLRGFHRPGTAGTGDDDSDDNSSSKIELKKVGPGKFEVSRAEVQQSMENPLQFFSQMRAMPHFVNGKTDGFSISQVAPGSVFAQLGLKNGDMVTSINGQPVTNPMQAMGLMQAMKTQTSLDLVVNRDGTPTSVHLDLR